jgi:hypothetical protein
LPALFVIELFTSMGSTALPVMFAFGIVGHRIAGERTYVTSSEPVVAGNGPG